MNTVYIVPLCVASGMDTILLKFLITKAECEEKNGLDADTSGTGHAV